MGQRPLHKERTTAVSLSHDIVGMHSLPHHYRLKLLRLKTFKAMDRVR